MNKTNMKKTIFTLIVCTAIGMFQGCKESGAKGSSDEKSTTEQKSKKVSTPISDMPQDLRIIKNMDQVKDNELPEMLEDANRIINHRYEDTERKAYIIVDKDLWEYEFIFKGKEMTKPGELKGNWIDFNQDLTYTYGKFDEVRGSGIFTYDAGTGLMILIDDNSNIKPQEFEAKVYDATLIMDGNAVYKDNNYNAKLKRVEERPRKSSN